MNRAAVEWWIEQIPVVRPVAWSFRNEDCEVNGVKARLIGSVAAGGREGSRQLGKTSL
jgi:hypothetical protein